MTVVCHSIGPIYPFYNEAGSQIVLDAETLKVRHTLITLQFVS